MDLLQHNAELQLAELAAEVGLSPTPCWRRIQRLKESGVVMRTVMLVERQRVAIARALLRRPAIYVLDEPTSMLDSNTEAGILRTLQDVTAGCTTIVIAHRLSTVMHADEIIVMDGGHVRERGRHADLLAQPGLYVDLWARQRGKR